MYKLQRGFRLDHNRNEMKSLKGRVLKRGAPATLYLPFIGLLTFVIEVSDWTVIFDSDSAGTSIVCQPAHYGVLAFVVGKFSGNLDFLFGVVPIAWW